MGDDEESARGKKRVRHDDLGLLDSLVQLSFAVQGALARVADTYELSLAQVRVLGILRDREPAMLELATFLDLDKSSVTGLVTRAERRGLVQRVDVPDDRRAVRVKLTSKGRELARTFADEVEKELASLVKALSAPDRKLLSGLASQIVLDEIHRRLPSFLPPLSDRHTSSKR